MASEAGCKLVGGFSVLLQLALCVIALGTLFVKRCLEQPKRPYKIFVLDTVKQVKSK